MSKYRDKREEFFRQNFANALPYEKYVTGTAYEAKWRSVEAEVEKLTVPPALENFRRKMPVLILSGIWCGDCSRQGPMFRRLEKLNPVFEIRFAESSEFLDLKEELRINGAEKVPVVVTLNEDFHELSRFGDRHLSVYRTKLEKELGAACDPGILPPLKSALQEEFEEWVGFFERLQIMLRLAPGFRQRYGD
jgi:hypothetical protein